MSIGSLARFAVFCLSYVLLAYASVMLVLPEEQMGIIWLPDTFLLLVLLFCPRRQMWIYGLLAAISYLVSHVSYGGHPTWMVFFFWGSGIVAPYLTAWWVREDLRPQVRRDNYMTVMVGTIARAIPLYLIGAFLAALAIVINLPDLDFIEIAAGWFVGAVFSLLLVFPAGLSAIIMARNPEELAFERPQETMFFFLAVTLLSVAFFRASSSSDDLSVVFVSAFPFLAFSLVIWSAIRHNHPGDTNPFHSFCGPDLHWYRAV